MIKAPYFPIIYLRGYAGSQGDIEDTVSTPYMGFNLGSTRIRQRHTGEVQPHVFESPVIRLMKDHNYVDAYHNGQLLPPGPVPSRSIWIFRYYDVADKEFGDGQRKEIEFHAEKLRQFLRHVRKAVLDNNEWIGVLPRLPCCSLYGRTHLSLLSAESRYSRSGRREIKGLAEERCR